ncbi:VCBS domain-containing protein, partial [Colwelliaceae bacterium BS250]
KAVIAGTAQALITEDKDVRQGQLHADGQLTVTDLDAGENQFSAGSLQGQFGTLAINNNGHWTYTADNSQASIQGLNTGESLTETLIVHSVDGTEQKVTVTINGTDDKAVIAGTAQALITEDKDVRQGQLHADGQLTVTDLDAGENQFTAGTLQGQFGTLAINNNGHWTYTADNSQASIQGLTTGESLTDTVLVHSVDGSEQKVTVTINGTDDKAVIAGTAQALITEDKDVRQGQLHADGQLTVTDLDAGENQFQASSLQGQLGTLSINSLGHWTYTADNSQASIQGLKTGESLTDTVLVHSVDGTEQKVTVTINGTDDKAVIAGTAQALITEDKDVRQGQLHADGQLTVTDLDTGENQFTAGSLQGQFGTLSINNQGHWTYTADNSQPTIQGLKTGEAVIDTVLVHSVDGTSQQISVTINGTDDKAQIAGTSTASLTEDKGVHAGQLRIDGALTVTDNDNGQAQFQATSLQGQFGTLSINNLGHWTYTTDNSQPTIQGLKTNESVTDTVLVHSVDGTSQQVTVTINGTDDKAVIAGTSTASITEDKDVHAGLLRVDGSLTVTDVDNGQAQFQGESLQGKFGTLSINNLGHWTYTADNSQPTIQGLKTGESITDTVLVHSVDGTSQQVAVTINGTDDKAVISGVDTGSVTENNAGKDMSPDQAHAGMSHLTGAMLYADGKLNISDPDAGDNEFDTNQGGGHGYGYTYHGSYGQLILNADGGWHYNVNAGSQHNGAMPGSVGTAIDKLGVGESLTDTITVRAKDGTTHDISITIHGSNDRPYCSSEVTLASGTEDTDQTFTLAQLLANSVDVDKNDAGQMSIDNLLVDHGSILDNKDGTFTLTQEKNYNGQVHLSYNVTDKHGGTTHTGASTTLSAVNDAAIVSGDVTGDVFEDHNIYSQNKIEVTGHLLVTDPDVGQQGFQYTRSSSVSDPFGGSLHISASGTWTYDVDNAKLQHLGANQEVLVTHRVYTTDGTAQDIIIKVTGTNDAPVVSSEVVLQTGTEDTDIIITQAQLLANSSDIDSNDLNQLHIDSVSSNHGVVTKNADGSFIFHPDQDYNGQVHFTYDVKDGHSGVTHTGATTSLTAIQDNAVITGQDSGDVKEDVNVGPVVAGNANMIETHGQMHISDPDAGENHFHVKNYAFIHDAGHPELHPIVSALGGYLSIGSDGTWFYRIDTRKSVIQNLGEGESTTDTVTITSIDGTSHVVTVTIHGTNDAPFCSSEVQLSSGTEDTVINLTSAQLLANASDIDANDLGQLSVANLTADHGSIVDNKDGTFSFNPAKDYNGDVHFSYDVKDIHGGVTHTGATTTLSAVNDNPDAQPVIDSITEDTDTHHAVNLLSGATDVDGDSLSISQVQVSFEGKTGPLPKGVSFASDGHTLVIDSHNPTFQHLSAGQNSDIVVHYMVDDNHGGQTAAVATITMVGTDDKATLASNIIQMTETQALDSQHNVYRGNLQLIDPDSGDNTQFLHSGKYVGQGYSPGYFDVFPDGSYQFSLQGANNRYADDRIASLRTGESTQIPYEVETSDGQKLTIMVKVIGEDNQARIEVAPYSSLTNHAYEDRTSASTPNEIWSSGNLHVIDPDHDQAGFVAQRISTPEGGEFYINPRGNWAYTIDNSKVQHLGAGESYQKTFTVESIDGSAHQDITVTVHGTNDNPIIASAVMLNNGVEDTQITLTSAQLLANATDIDDNDVKQLSIANLHADHGSIVVNLDGTYTFTPEKNFNGQVNFSYDVKDGHSGVTHTTATTTLAAVRDAAIITEVTTGSVTEDGSNRTSNNGVITELASGQLNVVDPDSGENHFDFSQFAETAIHDPFGGNLHIDRAGNWGYTVDNANLQHLSQGQTEVVIYQVHSQDGTPYELHINVLGTNDVPTVSLVTLSHGTEDVNYQMQASQFGFTDVDSTDTLHSINLTDLPDAQTQGAFLLDGHTVITGQSIAEADLSKLQFVPVKDFNGDVDFKYTVNDGHSDSLEATNTLHIDPVQDVASIDGQITSSVSVDVTEDSIINSINGHMILIDLDAGEDKFVANSHIQGTYGHLAIDADGNWQYNLDNNLPNTQSLSKGQVVTDSITITSPDGTASQTLNIAVHGHDDLLNLSVNEGDTLQSLDLYGGLKSGIINNVQFSTDGVHYSHQVPDGFVLASDGHTLQVDASHGSYNHLANGIASNIQIKFELQQGSGTNAVSTPQQALVVITGTSDSPIIHSFNPHAEQDTGPINGNLLQGASDVDDGANLILHDVQFQDPTTHNYVTVQAGQTHHILGVGSIAIASSGDYTFTPDSHFSGDVPRFIYRVTDTHGDYKDESQNTLNIKIDAYTTTIKPSVDIDAKSNSGISDHDNITNIHTPLVTGIVEAGARVVITDEKGQTVGSETATSAGAYSITTSTLSEGAHTLTVTATDAAGNTASTSQALVIDNSLNATDDVNTAVEDQGPTATQGNVLTNDDHDGTSITAGDVSGTYGTFHFSADGSYTYELDNSSVQSFVQGEKHDDNAIYTITDSAGNTTSAGLTVNITGTNDLPVISGSSTGAVIEKGSSNAGTAEVTGTLIATDPDTGDTLTWAVPSGAGVYGDLTLDQHGHWHYSLDNTAGGAADNLAAGQHAQESFWATATDSSGVAVTHKIYVGVTGSNDLPVISGSSTGAVIEKGSSNAGTAEVTGTLTATDPDTGDTLTWAVTNSAGTYGNLSIDQQGQWHYQLDNSNQATNALSANQQEQETFIVTATDSSGNPVSQTLTVDVQGSNDAPPVPKLVTPPKITGGAGSQGLHTSLGIPPIVNPNLAPTPLTGWGISDGHGHSITSLHGQFGTLHVNPATGNLDYQYQQNSGIQKSGTGHSGGETDTFYLTLGGADNSMVEVHLHLYSRSIHGNSGHHIDQTTLQGLDITPLTGAPGASASDEPSPLSDSTTDGTDIQSFEFDASLIDDSSIAMVTEGRDDEILRPVDHYLQMVGASKQHAEHNIGQSPDDSHLAAMTTADTSANADPLLDDIQSDAFENPLDDDQHQIHHHDGNIFDHPDDTAHLDNLRQDDDDSLNQALIDMHSQL